MYTEFLNACERWKEAEHYFISALLVQPNHWLVLLCVVVCAECNVRDCLYSYAQFLQNRGELEWSQKFFGRAEQIGTRITQKCTLCVSTLLLIHA
jgi:hypothetical protein